MPVKDYLEPQIDLSKVDELLETWPEEAGALPTLLDAVMDLYGYLPLQAAKRIVQVRGVDLSDLFGIATMSPKFKPAPAVDRKSTRLNSSHQIISYAVFCLKKKKMSITNLRESCTAHFR